MCITRLPCPCRCILCAVCLSFVKIWLLSVDFLISDCQATQRFRTSVVHAFRQFDELPCASCINAIIRGLLRHGNPQAGATAHPVPQDGSEHAGVVPLALLLRVDHRPQQVLTRDLVQYWVEAIVQDLMCALQCPGGAVRAILAMHQLPLVVIIYVHGTMVH